MDRIPVQQGPLLGVLYGAHMSLSGKVGRRSGERTLVEFIKYVDGTLRHKGQWVPHDLSLNTGWRGAQWVGPLCLITRLLV